MTLRAPIVQAPLGSCDGPLLAGSVSAMGALGCLTVHATPVPLLRLRLKQLKSLTTRPVLIALTAQWEREEILDTCLEAGFRYFMVFWWNGTRQTRRIHAGEGTVFWQVGSLQQAEDALETGADILVAQGTEAGGQVRSPYPLRQFVGELAQLTDGQTPIVAGGGLADARDVSQVLSWGASAALLGTRFLLSEEARSPMTQKARLARASSDDLFLDPRLVGDWPCAPRRRLNTAFDQDTPGLFAGVGLSRMPEILSAAEIVTRLRPT